MGSKELFGRLERSPEWTRGGLVHVYNIQRNVDGSVAVSEVGEREPLYTLAPDTVLAYKEPGRDLEVKQVRELAEDTALVRALMFKWTPL